MVDITQVVVYNTKTKNFVGFKFNGVEIEINSDDPRDNDFDCIVTTWDNIYRKNVNKRSEHWEKTKHS